MYDSDSKGISYSAGFFMLIGFAIAGIILASVISIPIWTNMTGRSIKEMDTAITDPANSNAVRIIQSITAVIGFLLPAILTAFLLNRRPMKLIGFQGKINWKQVGLVLAIMFVALLVSGFLSYVNEMIPITESLKLKFDKMEADYNKQVEAIIGLNNAGEYILALIIMAFLPALCEETLFRGGLQNFLTRSTKMPWLSIIIVSILFSLAHFSFYGFLSRFFLGAVLGLLYQYSGKIWLNILAHFFNNAFAITALYIYKLQGKSLEDAINNKASTFWGILALPIVIVLLMVFKKITASKEDRSLFEFEEKQENPLHGI
ncbi:MAG TPA: type II CAAX endopeptidase family protein [Chitinophagaceae bacterium]|nr:type II CAAX endopeptidase family protein [Chitinophagaceae bacterium]